MPAADSPITRQTVGKTFTTAISILGIGALVQIGAVGWVFYQGFQTTPLPAVASGDTASLGRTFGDPFGDTDSPGAPAPAPSMEVIPARPVSDSQFAFKPVPINPEAPVRPQAPKENTRFSELVEQARTLRERGDTSTAITRLREALALEPRNPLPLAEIASTYERMGAAEKAAEYWRRIYDLGASAGVYYTAAEAKMKVSQAQALMEAMPSASPAPTNVEALANAASLATPPPPSSAASAPPVGMFPGSRLGFGTITSDTQTGLGTERKMVVRVPVHAKARARIDVNDVTIQVIFYDLLNGRTLEKTNAEVSYQWANPPADWADSDVEVLEVSYLPAPPVQGEPIEDRKFYGYLARVYYKDALQDARAEPMKLGQTYPAPRMLQPDSAP